MVLEVMMYAHKNDNYIETLTKSIPIVFTPLFVSNFWPCIDNIILQFNKTTLSTWHQTNNLSLYYILIKNKLSTIFTVHQNT